MSHISYCVGAKSQYDKIFKRTLKHLLKNQVHTKNTTEYLIKLSAVEHCAAKQLGLRLPFRGNQVFVQLLYYCDVIDNFFSILKSDISIDSLYYAEACNEFAGPNSASLHPDNTAHFEEMSQS